MRKEQKLSETIMESHRLWMIANYSIKTLSRERGLPESIIRYHAKVLRSRWLLNRYVSTDWKYDRVIIYSGIAEDRV